MMVGCTGGSIAVDYAPWELVDGQNIDANTSEFEVMLRETACAGGASAEGRIEEPDIDYTPNSVVVTIPVRMLNEDVDCPANRLTPYTVTLTEPLGQRELLDGASGEPSVPDLDP